MKLLFAILATSVSAAVMTTLLPEFAHPPSNSGVDFSRTVKSISHATGQVTFDKGCTSTDPYGSNNCHWDWNEAVTVAYQGALQEDITSGKLVVDMKVNNVIPFQFTCPICGANCTIEIPIIKQKETFAMPPCPIKAETVPPTKTPFTMPKKNPLGVAASVTGTVQVTDQAGATVILLSINADLK